MSYTFNLVVVFCSFDLLIYILLVFAASQPYKDDQPSYVPSEIVGSFCPTDIKIMYHCYIIELNQDFDYAVPIHDLVLGTRSELESDIASTHFELQVGRGSVRVALKYVGQMYLDQNQVRLFSIVA